MKETVVKTASLEVDRGVEDKLKPPQVGLARVKKRKRKGLCVRSKEWRMWRVE